MQILSPPEAEHAYLVKQTHLSCPSPLISQSHSGPLQGEKFSLVFSKGHRKLAGLPSLWRPEHLGSVQMKAAEVTFTPKSPGQDFLCRQEPPLPKTGYQSSPIQKHPHIPRQLPP